MRYFLLDKITHVEPGKKVHGIKCVTLTDQILHDHFPDKPIMPGALILEGCAQLAGFLLETTANRPGKKLRRAVLAQADKFKFHKFCEPGDTIEMKVEIVSQHEEMAQVQAEASVQGEKRVGGLLNFALLEIDNQNITNQRLQMYRIWTKDLKNCPELM